MTLSEQGHRSSEPGGIIPESSQLLRKIIYGSANRIGIVEAPDPFSYTKLTCRQLVRDLVPVAGS